MRIGALTELDKELRKLRRRCRQIQKAKDCGILLEIGRGAKPATTIRKRHVPGTH